MCSGFKGFRVQVPGFRIEIGSHIASKRRAGDEGHRRNICPGPSSKVRTFWTQAFRYHVSWCRA